MVVVRTWIALLTNKTIILIVAGVTNRCAWTEDWWMSVRDFSLKSISFHKVNFVQTKCNRKHTLTVTKIESNRERANEWVLKKIKLLIDIVPKRLQTQPNKMGSFLEFKMERNKTNQNEPVFVCVVDQASIELLIEMANTACQIECHCSMTSKIYMDFQ